MTEQLLLKAMAVSFILTLSTFGGLGYVAWKDGWISIVTKKDMYRD